MSKMSSNGNELYRRYILDSIVEKARIGKYTSIANRFRVIYGQHPTRDIVSTYPAFYSAIRHTNESYISKTIFEEYKYVDKNRKYYLQYVSHYLIYL